MIDIRTVLFLALLPWCLSVSAQAAGEAGTASAADPLKTGTRNTLDIPVPEAELRPRDDDANRVLDPGASSRALDSLRENRQERSTQRYRPSLPSRRDERSVDARAERRLDEMRYPRSGLSRPGRPGF